MLELVEASRCDTLRLELRTQHGERIPRRPFLELALRPIGAGIATRVSDEPVRECLDERRPVALAHVGERTCGSLAHEPDAHAVDRLRRDVHDLRARSDLARRHRAERRVLAVAVVLADEEEGQLQDLAEVEALEDVTLVHRTVAEIRHGNAACRALQRQRGSRRRGDAAADDPE